MTAPRHVAIIGAGIVGVATAIWLRREGVAVTLIDRGEPGAGASFGNGGVLASASVVPVTVPGLLAKAPRMLMDPDQPLFLRWAYLPRLAPWLARYLRHCRPEQTRRISRALAAVVGDSLAEHQALAAGTRAERFVVPSDYLYVYRDRAAFAADAFGWALRREVGVTWEELEGPAFRAYDPIFSPEQGFAARMGDHGRIADPGAYVAALAAHAVAAGARLLRATVTDVVKAGGRLTGLRLNGAETLDCDAAVLAAGAWSKPLAKAFGVAVPLESERGYHLELWDPSAMPRSPVMIAAGKFVATPMEGRIRLAGVVEFGGLEAGPSEAPRALLRRNARAAFPGLRWAEEREWMGHRPAPSDSIPLIGPAPVAGGWFGFGHHHVGMTAGPRTGRWLAQMIAGRAPNIDLAPYAPARFQIG